jgi:hypothetical protein
LLALLSIMLPRAESAPSELIGEALAGSARLDEPVDTPLVSAVEPKVLQ